MGLCMDCIHFICLQSGERGTPSRRSKSEGPHRIANGQVYPIGDAVHRAADNNESVPDAGKVHSHREKKIQNQIQMRNHIAYCSY